VPIYWTLYRSAISCLILDDGLPIDPKTYINKYDPCKEDELENPMGSLVGAVSLTLARLHLAGVDPMLKRQIFDIPQ